jgi:transposase
MTMPKTYKITEKQMAEISEERKRNKDKDVEKRLRSILLRGEGKSYKEIAAITEAHPKVISRWFCNYVKNGLKVLLKGDYIGNRRNMSLEEEREFIHLFKEKAEKGEYVTVKEIKIAYCKRIGHICGKGQIYRVLKRQQWRKAVPRKKHPKRALEAEIEASKKN